MEFSVHLYSQFIIVTLCISPYEHRFHAQVIRSAARQNMMEIGNGKG